MHFFLPEHHNPRRIAAFLQLLTSMDKLRLLPAVTFCEKYQALCFFLGGVKNPQKK